MVNLVPTFQAAYTGPVVMMLQIRQKGKDPLVDQNDQILMALSARLT
jgi:uncharacterized membrane protein